METTTNCWGCCCKLGWNSEGDCIVLVECAECKAAAK